MNPPPYILHSPCILFESNLLILYISSYCAWIPPPYILHSPYIRYILFPFPYILHSPYSAWMPFSLFLYSCCILCKSHLLTFCIHPVLCAISLQAVFPLYSVLPSPYLCILPINTQYGYHLLTFCLFTLIILKRDFLTFCISLIRH